MGGGGLTRALVVGALCLLAARIARADAGEVRAAFVASGTLPAGGGAALDAQLGVTDWLSAELSAGGAVRSGQMAALGAARMTAALDVLTWVPELFVGIGMSASASGRALRVLAGGRLRRFVSPEWSWTIGLAGERRGEQWLGVASLGVWWQLRM